MQTETYTNTPTMPPVAVVEQRAGKYLTFRLKNEEFAIEVLKVREIVGIQEITAVPHVPHYIKGVINLRGKVIPVLDLRLKCGLEEAAHSARTCIIVVQVKGENTGVIVDEVTEVLNIAAADIEDTPKFGSDVETPFLLGIAKIKGKVKMLLDIDEVLRGQTLEALGSLTM